MIQPWHWFVFGIILMILELFTMAFAALWFGMAAILVSGLLWLFPLVMPTWQIQALVWLGMSVFSAISWFQCVQPLWAQKKTKAGLGGGTIIGETGMLVKAPMSNQAGTVRFRVPKVGSTEWQCRSRFDNMKMGDRVIVVNIIGNELMVTPLNQMRQETRSEESNR